MDGRKSKRSFLVTMDTKGRWQSSSIPDCASLSISGRDNTSSRVSGDHKIEKIDRRTWIWSGGWDSSLVFSSGFNYVALQGKDTLCVVTSDKKMEKEKFRSGMGYVIVEIQGNGLYGYNKRETGNYLGMLPDEEDLKPFAAVNVVLGTTEDNAERGVGAWSVGLNEKKVIDTLMRKVENGSGFSYAETVQTAISALLKMESKSIPFRLQVTFHLRPPKLLFFFLQVCVWRKGARSSEQLSGKEILEHWDVVKQREQKAKFKDVMCIIADNIRVRRRQRMAEDDALHCEI